MTKLVADTQDKTTAGTFPKNDFAEVRKRDASKPQYILCNE
jgi:hypothetical protein